LGGSQREEQHTWLAHEGTESVVPIEGNSLIILSIDEKREGGDIGLHRAMSRVSEQSRSEATALKSLVDSQPTDAHRRQSRIAGQTFSLERREVNDWDARGRERVIGGNLTGRGFDGYEAIRHAASNILGGLGLKVSVERFLAAVERRAVMRGAKRLHPKRRGGHSAPSN
jgi:hypothetical protein